MPHLLNVWPSVSQRLRDVHQVLLMLDYDGTLTPIVDLPELAVLSAEARGLLLDLNRQEKYLVGIISGRSLQDLCSKVDVEGLIYGGNHGLEMQGPDLDFVHPEAERMKETLGQAFAGLLRGPGLLPGVIVEHKGLTLSVHYRMTPAAAVCEVEAAVAAAAEPFVESGSVKVTRGKKVMEVRPNVPWNKGEAISELRAVYAPESLPLFFGDDTTDEDGFSVVQGAGGLAVFVGSARMPTQALHRVDSPQEVVETLRLMAQL